MNSFRQDFRGTIGFFDSGLGGLTVLAAVRDRLPEFSVVYLGDNARAPYGELDHDTIFRYAREGVSFLLRGGCPIVIVACNTASAQALRRIQQEVVPREFPGRRVLGVIRPSAEAVAELSPRGRIGVFGTPATASSGAYGREIRDIRADAVVTEVGVSAIVPLVESGRHEGSAMEAAIGAAVHELLSCDPDADTVLLGCTHFPLIRDAFAARLPPGLRLMVQGEIVAEKLADYLLRHRDIKDLLSQSADARFFCTGDTNRVGALASRFVGTTLQFRSATV